MKVFKTKPKLFLTFGFICVFVLFLSISYIPSQTSFAEYSFDDLQAFINQCQEITSIYDITQSKEITLKQGEYQEIDGKFYVSENAISTYNLKKTEKKTEGFYIVKNNIYKENDEIKVESQPDINRLIVVSNNYVDNHGAIMSARYKQYNIFQYDNRTNAYDAFDYYSHLDGVNVSYDAVVSIQSENIETYNTDTHKYNSWANDYMHYDDYIVGQLNSFDELPTVYAFVLDTGIFTSHNIFSGRIDTSLAKDFVNDGYSYLDRNGHGTHVSGTIAEFTKNNVKIVPYKVLGSNGKGPVTNIITAVQELIHVKQENPNMKIVMNMSLGVDYSETPGSASYSPLTSIVEEAYKNGIVPVVAAGNESQDTANCSPASSENAIVVSGLKIATYPNKDLVFDNSYSNFGYQIDFAAPGTRISSALFNTSSGTTVLDGTSMATPHITACFALIYSNPNYKDYSQEEAYELLKENCVDVGSTGRDRYYGWGYINMGYIGVNYSEKYVTFNHNQTSPSQKSINVTLEYNDDNYKKDSLKIYYTFDENVTSYDYSNIWKEYSIGTVINLTASTKITAIAFMQNENGKKLESYLTSKIFYIDNYDIMSNYEIDGVNLIRYKGELKVLNLPTRQMLNGKVIIGIQSYAFARSNVTEINLPDSVKYIYGSAFNSNLNIQRISGQGVTHVSDNAFNGCKNLYYVNFPNVLYVYDYSFADCDKLVSVNFTKCVHVGNGAFVNCQSLEYLNLSSIESLCAHSISNTNLDKLILGENVKEIGEQEELKQNCTVYGYASTLSYDFAIKNNLKFYNLTLRATKTIGENRKYIVEGEELKFEINLIGLDVKLLQINNTSNTFRQVGERETVSDYEYKFTFEYIGTNITNSIISIVFTDFYNNKKIDSFGNVFSGSGSAKSMEVYVLENNQQSYTLSFEGDNYKLKVNGEIVTEPQKIYSIGTYELEVIADEGWVLSSILLSNSSNNYVGNPKFTLPEITGNVLLRVETRKLGSMSIQFIYNTDGGNALINGNLIQTGQKYSVNSEHNYLDFVVQEKNSYQLLRVYVDGQELKPNGDIYSLTNIYKDIVVYIEFIHVYYQIDIQCGVGGTYSSSIGDLGRGEDRIFNLSASDGYEIDYVTINGVQIQVDNNSFIINNANEDYNIVISFKKVSGLFAGNSVILEYFVIFIIIFVLFVLSKISIYIIRKKSSGKNNNYN